MRTGRKLFELRVQQVWLASLGLAVLMTLLNLATGPTWGWDWGFVGVLTVTALLLFIIITVVWVQLWRDLTKSRRKP